MATNGQSRLSANEAERIGIVMSALLERMDIGARLGEMYGGDRDLYEALGWKRRPGWDDYYTKYCRQDIAGSIIDKPVDATWHEGFALADNEDPDSETAFEKAWRLLARRLQLTEWMKRLDRLSGIGEYAVMYLAVRGQDPATPLAPTSPENLRRVRVFRQPDAGFGALNTVRTDERFGLPEFYELAVNETSGFGAEIVREEARPRGGSRGLMTVHWTRVIHAADIGLDSQLYGRPRLQRVYNLLDVLQLVIGASGEAFWRGARPRYHGNIDPEFQGRLSAEDLEQMSAEFARFIHGMQDYMKTWGTNITQFSATVGDPRAPAEVAIELIAAATRIPKRILIGSERGELASSQDAQEWSDYVRERQTTYAEPVIARETIDRLIAATILPEPDGGEYELVWSELRPSADQRVARAERIAKTEAVHAQAELLGKPLVTRNELREQMGLPPIPAIDEQYPGETAEKEREEQQEREAEQAAETGQEQRPTQRETEPEPGDEPTGTPRGRMPAAAAAAVAEEAPFVLRLPMITRATGAIQAGLLREQMRVPILAAVSDTADRAASGYGAEGADTDTLAVRAFIADFDRERTELINATTQQRVIETLLEGMQARETTRQLRTRVNQAFNDMVAVRARNIALTEAGRAASFGTLQGMLAAGVSLKTWHTQKDDRVRAQHAVMEGQTVPVDQPFVAPNGEEGAAPGLFPSAAMNAGCRCFPSTPEVAERPEEVAGLERRRAVHERKVLAAVRRALRAQQAAVLREMPLLI